MIVQKDLMHRDRLFDALDKYTFICLAADKGFGKTSLVETYLESRNLTGKYLNMQNKSDLDIASVLQSADADIIIAENADENILNHDFSLTLKEHAVLARKNVKFIFVNENQSVYGKLSGEFHTDILLLDPDALAFTEEESEVYFNEIHKLSLEDSQINYIYRKTSGWPLAYKLFCEHIQFKSAFSRDEILKSLVTHLHEIIAPALDKIIETFDESEREFLSRTVLMCDLIPAVVDDYLDIENSEEQIETLLGKSVFIYKDVSGYVKCNQLLRRRLYEQYPAFAQAGELFNAHRKLSLAYEKNYYYAESYIHASAIWDADRLPAITLALRDRYSPEDLLRRFVTYISELYPSLLISTLAGSISRNLPARVVKDFLGPLRSMINEHREKKNFLLTAQLQYWSGLIELILGDLSAAITLLQNALSNISLIGATTLESCILSYIATCYRSLNRNDKAMEYAQRALFIAEREKFTYAQIITLDEIACCLLRRGDPFEAEPYIIQALSLTSSSGHNTHLFLFITYSSCKLAEGDVEGALEWASKAFEYAESRSLEYDLGYSYYTLAKAHLYGGDYESAGRELANCLEYSDYYAHIKAAAVALQIKIFDHYGDTISSSRKKSELEDICRYHKFAWDQNRVIAMPAKNIELDISTLGEFTINGKNATTVIRRTSSLELLQYLICNYVRGANRDTIVDTLFEEYNEKRLNSFNVSLSTLRKALASCVDSEEKQSHIIRFRDVYKINFDAVTIDIQTVANICSSEEFSLLKRSNEVSPILTETIADKLFEASKLFRGDFMEDFPYVSFLDGPREKYRLMQVNIFKKLADFHFNQRNYYDFTNYYDKIIEIAPYLDDICLDYISQLLSINAYSKAKDVYAELLNNTEEDLKSTVSNKTLEVFHKHGIILRQ
ncbi:MAG: hypothetical protein Q4D99_00130 [Bacillota bacterium]|nr:hypothetical protein [Bacillota bacterium]